MRNILMFMSVLCLVACGGNSQSSGVIGSPADGNITVPDQDDSSSDVETAPNEPSDPIMPSDKLETSLGLDVLQSTSFETVGGTPMKFSVADNRIVGIEILDGFSGAKYDVDADTKSITRTEQLDEGSEYVAKGTLDLYGKSLGLSYADFGYYKLSEYINDIHQEDIAYTFVGGVLTNKVEKPIQNTEFNGTAIVVLHTWDGDTRLSKEMISVANDAGLSFDATSGQTELIADFTQADNTWYKVTILADNEYSSQIQFENPTEANIDADFIVSNNRVSGDFSATYYGENGVASEALVGVSTYLPSETYDGIDMNMVFGGVAK
ncbi:MAG: hypothetical protein IJO18_01410 [Alphaproteobacteria bacterium]|nr:hypothetical protein [Alphaproteobacteria bacterium]